VWLKLFVQPKDFQPSFPEFPYHPYAAAAAVGIDVTAVSANLRPIVSNTLEVGSLGKNGRGMYGEFKLHLLDGSASTFNNGNNNGTTSGSSSKKVKSEASRNSTSSANPFATTGSTINSSGHHTHHLNHHSALSHQPSAPAR